jgi:ketosteroid isomerase-like protein
MRTTLSRIVALVLLIATTSAQAADDPRLAAVRAADDEKVAAILAADRARLDAIFSDDLRYAHSSGGVDTKASYVDAVASGRTKYVVYEYQERNFTLAAPGVALMTGKIHAKSTNAAGATNDNVLGFLAVWREENGKWRFLAWQSCKLAPAAPAPAAK